MRRPTIALLILAAAVGIVYAVFGVIERQRAGAVEPGWLDPDEIGDIAMNLCRSGQFSEREGTPTLLRGPAYPGLLAAPCLVTGIDPHRLAPYVNALFHALTILVLAVHPVARAAPGRLAALAAVGLDPLLLNYSGRNYIEPLFLFSFALVVVAIEGLRRRPSPSTGLLLGLALGFSLLAKPSLIYFAPFLIAILLPKGRRAVLAGGLAIAVAALCVLPWTLRNLAVSGRFVPVATGAWEIVLKGETYSRYVLEEEGNVALEARAKERLTRLNASLGITGLPLVEREPYYRVAALEEMRNPPWSLPRRMAVQSVTLWVLGGDRFKTLVFAALQLPVMALAAWGVWRARTFAPDHLVGLAAVSVYLILLHTASLSFARYSMPLRPWLVLLAALAVIPRLRRATGA